MITMTEQYLEIGDDPDGDTVSGDLYIEQPRDRGEYERENVLVPLETLELLDESDIMPNVGLSRSDRGAQYYLKSLDEDKYEVVLDSLIKFE